MRGVYHHDQLKASFTITAGLSLLSVEDYSIYFND